VENYGEEEDEHSGADWTPETGPQVIGLTGVNSCLRAYFPDLGLPSDSSGRMAIGTCLDTGTLSVDSGSDPGP
jgi:hypothetical protein